MNTVQYRGHPIRFDDIANTRYVVLDDIFRVMAEDGVDVISQSHPLFTSSKTYIDDLLVFRLALMKKVFPLTEELGAMLHEAVPLRLIDIKSGHTDMWEDFRMTLEEITEFITDSLGEFVTKGSSERLIEALSANLSYLNDTETRLDYDYS